MKSCKKGLFCLIPTNTKRVTIWWGKRSFLFGNWRTITHPLYLWSNHNRIEVELHHLTSLPRIKCQKQSTMNEYQTMLMNSTAAVISFFLYCTSNVIVWYLWHQRTSLKHWVCDPQMQLWALEDKTCMDHNGLQRMSWQYEKQGWKRLDNIYPQGLSPEWQT